MRELEVRRHTMRTQPGQHLSQAGVDLARRVGESMGRFDRVVTSTLPRAFETALAMGFAVDEQLEALSSIDAGVDAEVDWELGCAAFQRALRLGGATARYSRRQAAVWRRIVEAVPAGGRALVISHGGIVEAGTVGCLPDSDYTAWGPACGYCEGVRLHYDAGRWSDAQLLRL
jgi:broad specificity phosphatase PhoE